ncbi:MAG: hypothetical protein NW206_16155 [Hyphomonadaceae bacterium]|nr:hypothetical protein [Hyphomonadaceae bacterium]
MLTASLLINIIVLVPVLLVIAANGQAAERAWGQDTAARRILSAIYAAILVASVLLLAAIISGREVLAWAQALLGLQIVYKVLTVPLVGLRNPVILSNLAIAAVHAATLAVTAIS